VTLNAPARLAWRLSVLLVVGVLLVTFVVATRVWWVAREDDRSHAQAILVLGASQYNGKPSSVFAARLGHALELYKGKVSDHVVTVGGGLPGDNYTEAGSGKRWLAERGVPSGHIVAVETGHDTLQSLKAVDRVLRARGWHKIVIVTDPWHSLRSRTMARDLGIEATTSPARSGPAVRTRATEVRYVFRETAAYVYYELFGGSSDRGPNAL